MPVGSCPGRYRAAAGAQSVTLELLTTLYRRLRLALLSQGQREPSDSGSVGYYDRTPALVRLRRSWPRRSVIRLVVLRSDESAQNRPHEAE
jgi:hypothetical protein